jgi:hypothetical protein
MLFKEDLWQSNVTSLQYVKWGSMHVCHSSMLCAGVAVSVVLRRARKQLVILLAVASLPEM